MDEDCGFLHKSSACSLYRMEGTRAMGFEACHELGAGGEKPIGARGSASMLAEGVGFEPTNDSRRCRFSRPVRSTSLPPLRGSSLPRARGRRRSGDELRELLEDAGFQSAKGVRLSAQLLERRAGMLLSHGRVDAARREAPRFDTLAPARALYSSEVFSSFRAASSPLQPGRPFSFFTTRARVQRLFLTPRVSALSTSSASRSPEAWR